MRAPTEARNAARRLDLTTVSEMVQWCDRFAVSVDMLYEMLTAGISPVKRKSDNLRTVRRLKPESIFMVE
jgi:hypothetical protein